MCYECHCRVLVLEVCSSFQCKLGHAQRYVSQLTSGIRRNLDRATTTPGNWPWCCAALQGPVHCMPGHTAALCGASPSRLPGCPWWCHIRRAEQLLERRSDSIQTAWSATNARCSPNGVKTHERVKRELALQLRADERWRICVSCIPVQVSLHLCKAVLCC